MKPQKPVTAFLLMLPGLWWGHRRELFLNPAFFRYWQRPVLLLLP